MLTCTQSWPSDLCVFYGIEWESAEYLFHSCPKYMLVWNLVGELIGSPINLENKVSSSGWLGSNILYNPKLSLCSQLLSGSSGKRVVI